MKSSRSLLRAVEYGSVALVCAMLVGLTGCKESSSLSNEKEITKFDLTFYKASGDHTELPEGNIAFDKNSREIVATVPKDADLTWFIPKIEISANATIEPASGVEQNFSSPVVYIVTAEDGSAQNYRVTVKPDRSSAKDITEFKVAGETAIEVSVFVPQDPTVEGSVAGYVKTLRATIPFKDADGKPTDLSKLKPNIILNRSETEPKATVFPKSGAMVDFSQVDATTGNPIPVLYTVTAEDGSIQEYHVVVVCAEPVMSFPVEIAGIGKKITLYSTAKDTTDPRGNTAVIALSLSGQPATSGDTNTSTKPKEAVISFTVPGEGYDLVSWKVDGANVSPTPNTNKEGNTNILELKAGNYTIGRHSVTFTITIDGMPYSEQFYFTVDK